MLMSLSANLRHIRICYLMQLEAEHILYVVLGYLNKRKYGIVYYSYALCCNYFELSVLPLALIS